MSLTKKGLLFLSVSLLLASLVSASAQAKTKEKPAKVDLNTASQKELEDLPGVGEATAKKIVAGRPYSKVGDLEKAGVAQSTIDKIRKLVTVSKTSAKGESKPSREASSSAKASESKAPPAPAEKSDKKSSRQKPSAAAPAAGAPVNLNTASQKELEDLPGVGTATAKKIIAGRPYFSVDDLAKAGVSKRTIGKISPLVTVGAASAASKPAPSAQGSSAAPAPAERPAPASAPAAKSAPAAATSANSPAQPPPAKGMVWVNTATKVYHYEGDRWYGNTKQGKYMTEDEAIKGGYRASKEGQKKK
jgi:DNA uptake protein ComE-like DNA-binding protein